jgi:hypothetical protein
VWLWIPSAGYFSVVKTNECPDGHLVVRSRQFHDLVRLRDSIPELGKVIETPKRDYGFRAYVPQVAFADGLRSIALGLDYENVKAESYRCLGHDRQWQLHQVHELLSRPEPPPKKRRR